MVFVARVRPRLISKYLSTAPLELAIAADSDRKFTAAKEINRANHLEDWLAARALVKCRYMFIYFEYSNAAAFIHAFATASSFE
jgi:hypothetical protein